MFALRSSLPRPNESVISSTKLLPKPLAIFETAPAPDERAEPSVLATDFSANLDCRWLDEFLACDCAASELSSALASAKLFVLFS